LILFFELEPSGVDCARVEDLERADDFFNRFRRKLLTPFNLFNSPYSRKELYQERNLYCFLLEMAWFPFHYFGVGLLFACFLFNASIWWFVLPFFMTLIGVFWSPWVYLFMFKRGLRQAGFKGKVKGISSESFMSRVIEFDKES
jgi:hypothetical protein